MSGVLPRLPLYAFMALTGRALRHAPYSRTDACKYSLIISRANKMQKHFTIPNVKYPLRVSDLCVCVCVCVCVYRRTNRRTFMAQGTGTLV